MKVTISEYNPDWVNLFQKEKKLISEKLGDKIVTVEHIGSTSIPGLGAKPIIDILLGVKKISDADEFIPKMIELGYEYRNNFEHVMPYRRYFTKPGFYHVHTVEVRSNFLKRHILFRDYLRAHDDVRDAYYKLKNELAERDLDDMNDYALAKTEFIEKAQTDALNEYTFKTEKAECDALFELYSKADKQILQLCGIKTKRIGTALLIRTDIFPGFSHNRVPGLGLDKTLNGYILNEAKEFYKLSKNIFALQLTPSVLTDDVKLLLQENGFVFKKNWVRFYRDVSPIENTNTNLEINEIGKEHALDFGKIVTRAFDIPDELCGIFTSIIPSVNWAFFMAFEGSKPVSTGAVYFNGDTAWISFAATTEEYRGRGAQAALLKARIDEARKRGCKWISVETAEDTLEHDAPSYRNMLRYGFRLMYKRPNYVFGPK